MKKRYRHRQIVTQVSKETGIPERVIHIVIKKFYKGMKSLLLRNEEINIKGFFKLVLTSHYKNKVKKYGKTVKLRKRKDQKQYYVKKSKKKQKK